MPRILSSRAVGLALVAAGAAAQAGPTGTEAQAPPRCVPAAIRDVALSAPVAVDEIRVVVADGSPEAGAAEVVVATERSDRVLRVHGGSHGLTFFPPLRASSFRVSLSPIFGPPGGDACVDRIELRRGGAPVATVVP